MIHVFHVFKESFRSFKNFLILLTRTIRTNLIDKENGTNKQLYLPIFILIYSMFFLYRISYEFFKDEQNKLAALQKQLDEKINLIKKVKKSFLKIN